MENKSNDCLRQEILESQKARMDFLKFKFLAIAVLGAVALGLKGNGLLREDIDYILCILPFICIYIDFICYHNNIRILIIAQHLKHSGDEYEIFIGKLSSKTSKEQGTDYYFKLEDFVIFYTSFFVALLIIAYGLVKYNSDITDIFNKTEGNKLLSLLITGIVGFVIPFISKYMYENRLKVLSESAKKIKLNIQTIHNSKIATRLKEFYSLDDVWEIFSLLNKNETFLFRSLPNGLFAAAYLSKKNKFTNYDKVWVRDNVYVAFAHFENGESQKARRTILTLGNFFYKYKNKFKGIEDKSYDYNEPMNRPHIRFDGNNLEELPEKWAHAENDALGYYLWMLVKLIQNEVVLPRKEELELIPLFVQYFNTISYWKDEDSGHWEETRKLESSSIGVVICALHELQILISGNIEKKMKVDIQLVNKLIENGTTKIKEILPKECNQKDNDKYREVDAAQLFLIYPLNLFESVLKDAELEDKVLTNVLSNLKGKYGIKRYLGDSFWTADIKRKQSKTEITADYSERIDDRNKNHVLGEEAQWCIFDSIVSIIYGKKYQRLKQDDLLKNQFYYFNRALAQVTGKDCEYGSFKCPELYYIENEEYTNNDTVPLLWAQANLWLAFKEINRTLSIK